MSDLAAKAESYVDHIILAVRCEDKSVGLWRNLLDNWNAYSKGPPFVASGGKGQPQWFNKANVNKSQPILDAMHRRSRRADETIQRQLGEIVVVDHVVPVNVLRDMLIEQGAISDRSSVREFLEHYYRLCVITPDEHRILNAKESHTSRPNPIDLWTRYKKAGVDLIET